MKIAILFCILALIIGCSQEGKIKVGIILPLTGNFAQYGQEAKDGIMLAIEELKTIRIQAIYEDSKAEAKEGVNAFIKLVEVDGVKAVVTGTSQISLAVSNRANQEHILQIAIFTSTPDYTSANDYTFRMSPLVGEEIKVLGQKLINHKVGVIYLRNEWGRGAHEALREQLKNIIISESFDQNNEGDFRTQLTKIKAKEPSALVVIAEARSAGAIIKQARELGLNVSLYGLRGLQSKEIQDIAGKLTEGLVFTYPLDEESPHAMQFTQAFRKRLGYVPTAYAAEGYEAMKLLLEQVQVCGKNTDCMRDNLLQMNNKTSVFGSLSFDMYGNVDYPFILKTVRNGEFVSLRT